MSAQLPGDWRVLLNTCDVATARRLIVEMFERESGAAKARGEELWLEPTLFACLKQFAEAPSNVTAAALIEKSPQMWFSYFEGCLPGGKWILFRDMGLL